MFKGFLGAPSRSEIVEVGAAKNLTSGPAFVPSPSLVVGHASAPATSLQSMPPDGGDLRNMVRREVGQAVAASLPAASLNAPPVQLIVQNSTSVNATQQVKAPPPPAEVPQRWPQKASELSRQDIYDFWASPMNRICILGAASFVLYIWQSGSQHRARMSELDRRIDSNPFLRIVGQVLGASKQCLR
eukprot:TRINITY_DN103688_c0_g1_i1.p1 TRINITY_DN103688_c0_g1~~TRINITY_DN103688_c0_g1_i1.p1  ORF type:complete len:206 (+),score=43.00 TRINITY_DN103688_c0_g1_i1:60-620(+)